MDDLDKLARGLTEAAERKTHNVLRFSQTTHPGRYTWGSVQTDSQEVASLLCAMWNNRAVIGLALKQHIERSERDE